MSKAPHLMFVEARYYEDVSDHLLAGAHQAAEQAGVSYEIVNVPGALEIPAAVKIGLSRKNGQSYDGFVALGCIIRGETSHYDIVCEESARGLTQLSLDHNAAIGNAILTCENKAQAIVRADPSQKNKGADAVHAALALIDLKTKYGLEA